MIRFRFGRLAAVCEPLSSAAVRCALPCQYHGCRQAAAMIELLPGPGAHGTLRLVGSRPDTDVAEPLTDGQLGDAVRRAEPDLAVRLFDRGPAWAPFYCAVCERSYCVDHWHAQRCPYGHHNPG